MEPVSEFGFGILDYVIFAFLLLVSAGIGVYYRFSGGKQKSTVEYLLANRNMSVIPVGFSLMASFMSSITLLGVSSENYVFGSVFVLINISYIIGTPIAAYAYLPVFYQLQATSAYQYLEKRFGKATRLFASLAFITQMVLYMGIVLFAPALTLSAVTGLNKIGSICAVGLVCTFYSTIGGMKAVLVTDVFQSALMFASVICVVVKGSLDAGGMDQVWRIANEGGRLNFWNFSVDPSTRHSFWTQVIGGIFTYTSLYAVNQTQVQRLLTVNSLRKAQGALWLNWPILTALSLTTSFAGLAIYSHYSQCDPLLSKQISSPDQLLPFYVVETMGAYPGVAGLFVAGIFSGSLSTVSSALNSLSAVTMQDFLIPMFLKGTDDSRLAWYSQLVALVYGAACLALAFAAESLGGVLQASLTIFGVVGGPLLALFTVGMFSTAVEEKGAFSGLLCGLSFSLWIGFGGPKPRPVPLPRDVSGCPAQNATLLVTELLGSTILNETLSTTTAAPLLQSTYFPLYTISYMWYAPLGFLVTVLVSQIVSRGLRLFHCADTKPVHPQLLSPLFPQRFRTNLAEVKEMNMTLVGSKNLEEVGGAIGEVDEEKTAF